MAANASTTVFKREPLQLLVIGGVVGAAASVALWLPWLLNRLGS